MPKHPKLQIPVGGVPIVGRRGKQPPKPKPLMDTVFFIAGQKVHPAAGTLTPAALAVWAVLAGSDDRARHVLGAVSMSVSAFLASASTFGAVGDVVHFHIMEDGSVIPSKSADHPSAKKLDS